MKVTELKEYLPEKLFLALEKQKFGELRPCQEKAIRAGLLDGKNLLVCTPTGSGKTLVAEIALVKNILDSKGKGAYIVPLKSLALEKYKEFKEKYPSLKIGLSIGDLDSSNPWLANYDLVITTSEKLDSLIRHGANWINQISVVVVDEIHLLNDPGRGPTLEILITLLRKLLSNIQIIALSATIGNTKELATWLDANSVEDDWRPVQLHEGVFHSDEIDFFENKDNINISLKIADPTLKLAIDTISINKQALIFCPSKLSAEATAEKISKLSNLQTPDISERVLSVLSRSTRQCRRLAACTKKGIAFHHAGLMPKQKELIENAFKDGIVRIICCTPTLCLHSNSEIWQNLNSRPVKELKAGDPIFALNKSKLELARVKELNKLATPNKLVEIGSCSGYSIQVSPDHTFLIKRKKVRQELPASKIKIGDKIATVHKLPIKEKDVKWSYFIKNNSLSFKNKNLDEDLFYFIGAMLGDGYSGAELINKKIRYKGSPVIVGRDKEIFKEIKKTCKKYGIHYRENKNYQGVPQLILSKANWFREFLVRCGVDLGMRKYISPKLKSAPKEKLTKLLQGLFDTDGYVERRGRIGFSNISYQLIKDIQQCLLRWGIVTRIRKRKGADIKIHNKKYKTKECYELAIDQRKSILDFFLNINFKLIRKKVSLSAITRKYEKSLLSISCKHCDYALHTSMLGGRTKEQKEWGKHKLEIIRCLGKYNELGSKELTTLLGSIPRKKERRLNHHYDLISKRRIGSRSNTEWLWSLNKIGKWIYRNVILKNKSIKDTFLQKTTCPLCHRKIHKKLRGTWRKEDFEGDIFWDIVRKIKHIKGDSKDKVYDVVLDKSKEGFFVANGFLVHNSAGVNLPAFRAIMRSLKRFSKNWGSAWIPVLEYKQMTGRAGRPGMEKFGEAISLAKSEDEKQEIYEKYICGKSEPILSKLAVEPILRAAILSLVASGFTRTASSLIDFFENSFYGHQYDQFYEIENKIMRILGKLKQYGFIKTKDDRLYATQLGKRISELYIDPESGHLIVESLTNAMRKTTTDFSFLQLITSTTEVPSLHSRSADWETLQEKLVEFEDVLLTDIPKEWDIEYKSFLDSIKTALMLQDWIDERPEEYILEQYRVRPGELYHKLTNSDWMIYSSQEIARILGHKEILSNLNKTRLRIKYGIRKDLIPLVKLKGIGRFRARKLYANGIKTLKTIKTTNIQELARLIGSKTAANIKQQLEK